jgi:hypothetical protein
MPGTTTVLHVYLSVVITVPGVCFGYRSTIHGLSFEKIKKSQDKTEIMSFYFSLNNERTCPSDKRTIND